MSSLLQVSEDRARLASWLAARWPAPRLRVLVRCGRGVVSLAAGPGAAVVVVGGATAEVLAGTAGPAGAAGVAVGGGGPVAASAEVESVLWRW